MIDFEKLSAPFPPERISWRIGAMKKDKTAGMALAYLNARDVMIRLDEVCGPGGWQNRYSHAENKTVCEIGILVNGDEVMNACAAPQWVWKADGAGDSDVEAEKGSLSDAFKRSAVRWGIGRYLYDVPSPWVEVDEWKAIKKPEFAKLEAVLRHAGAYKPEPEQKPSQRPAEPPKTPLTDRANALEDAMRNAKPEALDAVWAKGSQLCAQLDTSMPERLVELEDLYKGLKDLTPFN